jgi:spore coat protein U-like protein
MQPLLRLLFALILGAASCGAWAQSCTITTAATLNSGLNYDPFTTGFNDTQGAFSITCTRPTGGQNRFPATFYVGATNGANYSGGTRRLRLGATASYLNYALYRNYPGCSTNWGSAALADAYALANSATGPNNTTTNPNPLTGGTSFCFRITGGVNNAIPGTYTDTIQVGVANNTGTIWGTAAVTLTTTVVASCTVSSFPTDVTLNYASFSASPVSAPSSFQTRCTNTTTYNLGFDAASGTVLGLTYNLTMASPSGTGNGTPQTYGLTVTLPAGQAGTCSGASCTSTVTRNVVISY